MPEGVESARVGRSNYPLRQAGLRLGQPTLTVGQQKTTQVQGDVYALPEATDGWQPLQDLDPDSDTFGDFWFLPGYDTPGDPTKPIRP